METLTLSIGGMKCAACAAFIERKLSKATGVAKCAINFATEQATVGYDAQQTTAQQIQQAVEAAGFRATLPSAGSAEENSRPGSSERLRQKLMLGGIVSAISSARACASASVDASGFSALAELCLCGVSVAAQERRASSGRKTDAAARAARTRRRQGQRARAIGSRRSCDKPPPAPSNSSYHEHPPTHHSPTHTRSPTRTRTCCSASSA